jgi:hypothetical protein
MLARTYQLRRGHMHLTRVFNSVVEPAALASSGPMPIWLVTLLREDDVYKWSIVHHFGLRLQVYRLISSRASISNDLFL